MMKRGTVVCSITQGDRSAIQIEVAGRLVDGKGDVSFDREDVVVYRADADPAAHVVDCAQKIEDMLDEDVCRADREETSMMRMIHMRSDLFALTAQMRQGSTAPQEAARTEEVADFARSLMLDIDAGVGLALSDTQIMDNLRERLVATTSDPDAATPTWRRSSGVACRPPPSPTTCGSWARCWRSVSTSCGKRIADMNRASCGCLHTACLCACP